MNDDRLAEETPMDRFIDNVFFPAWNDNDEVESVDPVLASGGRTQFDLGMADGTVWRLTIEQVIE